jgi:Uma2 family endonuclease
MNVLPETQIAEVPPPNVAHEIEKRNGKIIYPESHDDDMGETMIHIGLLADLLKMLQLFFAERNDVLVAANLNLYYREGEPEFYKTPDLMVCFGVENHPRNVFKLWEEKQFPQVVLEIASEKTWRSDISEKHEFYEQFGAEEYYLIDTEDFLPLPLIAFQRDGERLKRLILKEDRVFSPRLGLEIVHSGAQVKLFDPNRQDFLPTLAEATARFDEAQAEIERLRAELARLKGEN